MTTAVVGAGPAGLIAALTLAESGMDVILIDEHPQVGGHLRYDPYNPANPDHHDTAWRRELGSAIGTSTVEVRTSTVVWAAYQTDSGFDLMLSSADCPATVTVDRLILATGTTDRELNIPGSTLPGVMTERAVRILIETYGVIPGARFVVIGSNAARTERMRSSLAAHDLSVLIAHPQTLSSIGGNNGVEFVVLTSGKQPPADVVVIAEGERPDIQLAGMLGVGSTFDPNADSWVISEPAGLNGLWVVGGASLGSASAADLISAILHSVSGIFGTEAKLPEILPITAGLQSEVRAI